MNVIHFNFSREQLEHFSNQVLETTLQELAERGYLSEAQSAEIEESYAVLLVPKDSLLDKLKKLLFTKAEEPNAIAIKLLKIVP